MVHLTKIYTKTGDDGTTSLGDMSRTSKIDPRIEAFATVDELNSYIGVILSYGLESEHRHILNRLQNELFDLGADLCTPIIDNPKVEPLRIIQSSIDWLESEIDKYNSHLEPLHSFILPGGGPVSALFHVARTIARRAERQTWLAIHSFGNGMNKLTAQYLNRLSDLLFVLARCQGDREILWSPGADR